MPEVIVRSSLLVVDDIPDNIAILDSILQEQYYVRVATEGQTALEIAQSPFPPDLILLDIMMPGIDGYEVCKRLKANESTRSIPVIFVTAMDQAGDEQRGFEVGAIDYITKPFVPSVVLARIRTHLQLQDQNRYLELKVRERTAELHESRLQIIRRLGRAAEYKDNETGLHVIRMSKYCFEIALAAGLPYDTADLIQTTSPMHDIGKIGIPDSILLKPGKLDPTEWDTMKTHTSIGSLIIGESGSVLLQWARIGAMTHHEKWDGTGYPHGLTGSEIPVQGRVIAVADVFDALVSKRPYKDPWPIEKAVDYIREQKGCHFEPSLVDGFDKCLDRLLAINTHYCEK